MNDCLAGPNAIKPDRMSAEERVAAVADILATGLIRLRAQKSSGLSGDCGDCCLDFPKHPEAVMNPSKTPWRRIDDGIHYRPDRGPKGCDDGGPEAAVARLVRRRARRPTTGVFSKAGWPTASRNWPSAGLKLATVERLEALGEQLDGGKIEVRRRRGDDRPIAGTRLIREYQGRRALRHRSRRRV